MASGTAAVTDSGAANQNYSVQDAASGNVFVYYYGDPDSQGVGMLTALDNGDAVGKVDNNTTDKDARFGGDFDFYNTTGLAAGTQATTSNTVLHFVTNIGAQVWEFAAGATVSSGAWNLGDFAVNHAATGSNSSRVLSLAEAVALYAANFGGDNAGGNLPGAIQPLTNEGSTNGYVIGNDNRPTDWGPIWTAMPTPSGHAMLWLTGGTADMIDSSSAKTAYIL